jgi:CRISPR-associated protein Cas5t
VNRLSLLVEVPICAFRPYTSREYQDTYPVPTPSAVYGMLLSLVGVGREQNLEARQKAKAHHRGAEMALAVEREPEQSRVFRKLRRGEDLESRRPDYQDLLIDVRLWVWLQEGQDQARPTLLVRVKQALDDPSTVRRSGGLSLGESSYLIDRISVRQPPSQKLAFLRPDPAGFYNLPVWVDHQEARNTILRRFTIGEPEQVEQELPKAWFKIGIAEMPHIDPESRQP